MPPTRVCADCSATVNIRKSVCTCGHVFTPKKGGPLSLRKSKRVAMSVINPRRACARVTVLFLSVCLVCFPYSGTSRNQAYKQQYQRLQRDTGMKYKKGFFFYGVVYSPRVAPASFQGS